jgi:hypothetical protein
VANLTVRIPGTEIDADKSKSLLYPRDDAPSVFNYPPDRLFGLSGILTAAEIRQFINENSKGDPVRFVIKRSHTTLTTVGCVNGFESHRRRYGLVGNLDSVEVAVYPYNNKFSPFFRPGDSGAIMAGANREFIALLSGGTGPTNSCDVTYGAPMFWLWEDVIKLEFPGANLYFDVPLD